MLGVSSAIPYDDQPIGGSGAATPLHETRLLTSWITPDNPDIQNKYDGLVNGLSSIEDKVIACLRFASSSPYVQFVKVTTNVAGRSFTQKDCWLSPAEAMQAPKLNCANKSFLLASLLRQELPPEQVWTVLGNLNTDHQDGHAFVMVELDRSYILEATNPSTKAMLIPLEAATMYEDVIYFNDSEVKVVPERALREPFSACWNCISWLGDYVNREFCAPRSFSMR